MRQVVLYKDEDGRWVAECPSLPGCVSDGANREEAIENVKEAIEACTEALKQEGRPVPEERFNTLLVAV
ncbi:MAG: type II toxin-antitoxin system HicB family antitoxin [Deltaproteobacteria bacterium]|nr:type II toxin-antitoxin system HicB family antitoxin [Deltaproteobacteria bacterium]